MVELTRIKMKLKLVLSLFVLLSACNYEKDAIELNTEVIIDVTEKNKYLENLLEHHPDRQVKIYTTKSSVTGPLNLVYTIYVFRKRSGQQTLMGFASPVIYNKAAYKWANDSTVNFRVFNTTNRLSEHYTYGTYGTQGGAFLQTDSINRVP